MQFSTLTAVLECGMNPQLAFNKGDCS